MYGVCSSSAEVAVHLFKIAWDMLYLYEKEAKWFCL